MSKPTISVTDHAVVRYLDRVAGIDIERIRRGIRRKVKHAVNSGAKAITVDGFSYRIEGRRIVSVVPADRNHEPAVAFDRLAKTRKGKRAGRIE